MDYTKDPRNSVKRIPDRGHYDKATVYEILDSAFVCHVGFAVDGQPFVIPTAYGREGDSIYLHGANASRMLKSLASGIPACITVTHIDGLVLARSAFHHSMNYRSAVIFGTATTVADDEKEHALFVISENILKGRWEESRKPLPLELNATTVLRVHIETASAKIRTGPPKDEAEDYDLPIWAGVVPMVTTYGEPLPDEMLPGDIAIPSSVAHANGEPGA